MSIIESFDNAIRTGDIEDVKRFLREGHSPNLRSGRYQKTMFIHACSFNQLEIVKLLFKHDADINAVDKDGWSGLYWASKRQYFQVCKFLLDHGADPSFRKKVGSFASPLEKWDGNTKARLLFFKYFKRLDDKDKTLFKDFHLKLNLKTDYA